MSAAPRLVRPEERPAWKELERLAADRASLRLADLFAKEPARGTRLVAEACGIYLDYSKNLLTDAVLAGLVALAEECGLRERIGAMFSGEKINVSEDRAVLHVALRAPESEHIYVDGEDVVPGVHEVLDHMASFSRAVREGTWLGHTGRPIRNVVNIGIGGSDLGPAMAYEALRAYSDREKVFRFVSNIDGAALLEATRDLDPAETLFIVCSKSWHTQETLVNAASAREWLLAGLGGDRGAVEKHFVAVSTNAGGVAEFGIDPANMFGFWDWVGGRYSLDSAVGLSLMVAIGPEHFSEMLAGFRAVDEHFRSAPLEGNLPVLMGLLSVWYNDFLGAQSVAVLPYSDYLARFPAYLQQLEMESNGKHVDLAGREVSCQTAPVVWGQPGTNGQHAFYQALHQGTKLVPCELIGFLEPVSRPGGGDGGGPGAEVAEPGAEGAERGAGGAEPGAGGAEPRAEVAEPGAEGAAHHDLLMANMFAQAEALAFGRDEAALEAAGSPPEQVPHRVCPGNRPTTTVLMERLSPEALGKLVALYEHRVFTEGVIFGVDSFDQWGVELGKLLAKTIESELSAAKAPPMRHDSSTAALVGRYRKARGRP